MKLVLKIILGLPKVANDHSILCSDKHANWLRKNGKDPAKYRPDILHQVKVNFIANLKI